MKTRTTVEHNITDLHFSSQSKILFICTISNLLTNFQLRSQYTHLLMPSEQELIHYFSRIFILNVYQDRNKSKWVKKRINWFIFYHISEINYKSRNLGIFKSLERHFLCEKDKNYYWTTDFLVLHFFSWENFLISFILPFFHM